MNRTHLHGHEDEAAGLIPPVDTLRDIVRDEAIGAISEWATGWTSPIDGQEPRQHYIVLLDADEANSTLDLGIGEQRYDIAKQFRVRVLVEEIEPR